MKSNNILIVANNHDQREVNISKYWFYECTGVSLTEFRADDKSNLINWVKQLTQCSLVVTYGNWSEETALFSLVSIARQLQITVIHESNFNKYVSEQNN